MPKFRRQCREGNIYDFGFTNSPRPLADRNLVNLKSSFVDWACSSPCIEDKTIQLWLFQLALLENKKPIAACYTKIVSKGQWVEGLSIYMTCLTRFTGQDNGHFAYDKLFVGWIFVKTKVKLDEMPIWSHNLSVFGVYPRPMPWPCDSFAPTIPVTGLFLFPHSLRTIYCAISSFGRIVAKQFGWSATVCSDHSCSKRWEKLVKTVSAESLIYKKGISCRVEIRPKTGGGRAAKQAQRASTPAKAIRSIGYRCHA